MKPVIRKSKPSTSPARAAAFDILLRVEKQHAYASELLHARPAAELSPADHGLATELVMGVLRWGSLLDQAISRFASQKIEKLDVEVLTALRLGVYQLRFLERIPARAAINESVELVKRAHKRSAAPLVNAVLRKLSVEAGKLRILDCPATAENPAVLTPNALAEAYAHPLWLVERWTSAFGVETTQKICAYDQQRPQTAIRLRSPGAEQELQQERIELAPGELIGSARRVLAGDVTRTSAFREAKVVIQDEASQLVALLVGRGNKILDCCAAPGGKTAILAERNPAAEILAVELHPHRARLMRKLVQATNVRTICADARALPLRDKFDRILADVPCSGTGTLARNPDIKWHLKAEDLLDLHARQLEILQGAVAQLAPGGRLVYSTCSLEGEENAAVVERVLTENSSLKLLNAGAELERLGAEGELGADPQSLVNGSYLRTIPGVQQSDGFFAAILEKAS